MIVREATRQYTSAAVAVAVDSGLFPAEEDDVVRRLIRDYWSGDRERGHRFYVAEADGGVIGIAYVKPRAGTDGTCELLMLAVTEGDKGRGVGTALTERVEAEPRSGGQRLLLLETSGSEGFGRTRHFYERLAYEREALVRDYYEPGDDMVLYRKALKNT